VDVKLALTPLMIKYWGNPNYAVSAIVGKGLKNQ